MLHESTGTTLADIETAAREFAKSRDTLSSEVELLQLEIEQAQRRHMKRIKGLVASAAEHEVKLRNMVDSSRDLFTRPRTVVFHGIKVGLTKGKGGIEFEDGDRVVELIEKHFSRTDAERLIHVTKSPDKEAIQDLSAVELKKIGCTICGTEDRVVVRPVDSAVDKVVTALLKNAVDEAETAHRD